MNASLILTAVPWAGCVTCGALALSSYVRMARTKGGWRDAGCWFGPLIFTSATLAMAAAAGVLSPLAGVPLATAPLVVIAVRCARLWRAAAKTKLGRAGATRLVLSLLRDRVRDALWNAREDVRDLLGLLRRGRAPQNRQLAPLRATPGVPPWRRTVPGVPSVAADPALGPIPAPSQVSAALAASGVAVPLGWAEVAADVADHDPETDEEHVEHMDGEVAGILTFAEAAMSRAETLGDAAITGLDPAYISAQYELADAIADLASFAAQVSKRYHDIYDGIREAADGHVLPAKRGWFGDGGAPQGGQAA